MVSDWRAVEKDDIAIDHKEKEVNIYSGYDDNGSVYIVLTFEQIKEIAEKINGTD